ncbi:MAG: hypothetical protein AAB391_00310 [Patescibacteria group bacterium]
MTPELTEGNWAVELAELKRQGKISAFAQAQLTELIHTGGKNGISMPEDVFKKLTAEVFTIKFPAVRRKFILTYKAGRAYFSETEW